MISFSKRISSISAFIPPFKTIADVGCDHGYLIIDAILNQNVKFAQAIDNKKGPLDSAKENIDHYKLTDKVQFTLSDGLNDLSNDVEVVIIAGLSGNTIAEILEKDHSKLVNIKRIIVQPNQNSYILRRQLSMNNFCITNEEIVLENDVYYEILVFEPNKKKVKYTEQELVFGPVLLKNINNNFINKWQQIYKKNNELLNVIPAREDKRKEIIKLQEMIREVINVEN